MVSKFRWYKKYRSDMLIATLIAILPFLSYSHLFFADDIEFFTIFGFVFYHDFDNNRIFIWHQLSHLIAIILFLNFYFTTITKSKILIIPLIMFYMHEIITVYYKFYINHELLVKVIFLFLFLLLIFLMDLYYFKEYRKRTLFVSLSNIFESKLTSHQRKYIKECDLIMKDKNNTSLSNYFQKVFNAKLVLDKLLNNRININTIYENNINVYNSSIGIVLIITSSLWFLDFFIPDNVQSLDLGLFQLGSNGFKDVDIFIWFLSRKLILIIIMVLWFLTCQHWWKYAILSPIILYSYQFWEATQDVRYLDAAGNIKAFPAIFCIILILLVISKTIKYRVEILIMYEHLIGEIEDLIQNGEFHSNNRPYINVKRFKNLKDEIAKETNAKQQLTRLMSLREELLKQLTINF